MEDGFRVTFGNYDYRKQRHVERAPVITLSDLLFLIEAYPLEVFLREIRDLRQERKSHISTPELSLLS